MIRHNFMKGLALAFIVFLIFYACTSEQDYIVNDKDTQQVQPLTTANAHAWYEQNFGTTPQLKSGGEEELAVLMPDWNLSHLYEDSLWYAVESPLNTAEHAHVYLMTKEVNEYAEANGDKSLTRQVLRLIVLRNKESGDTYSFMMAILPDLDYMLKKGESIEENKYLTRDSDLSGLVYFYTVDGEFVNGWMYKDGNIVAGTHSEEGDTGTKASMVVPHLYCWEQKVYVNGELIGTSNYCEWGDKEMNIRDPREGGNIGGGGGIIRDPGPGGSGGGNGSIIIQEPPKEESKDPCENMTNKMSSPDFVNMLNGLRGLTNGNYEAGRSYTYNNGKFMFKNHDGNAGDPEIKFIPPSVNRIDGFIHSHYDGILKTFSPSDLMVPYNWFMKANGINDLNTFSLGLVTSEGTYFLFITDTKKYMAFGKMYGSDEGQNLLSFWYEKYGINIDNNDVNSMQLLLQFLGKFDAGLTLMKDTGNNKYSKVTRDKSGNIKITNCK